jgi:hypothetical protein
VPGTLDFEAILRGLRRRERVPVLVKALGLEPRLDPVPADRWSEQGLEAGDGVRAAFIVAERGALRVLLLELSGEASSSGVARIARRVRANDLARQHLFLAAGAGYRRILIGCFGLEGELRHLTIERTHVRRTDVEALEEMVAVADEGGLALAVRFARALDRSRVTRQFFDDFADRRARVAGAWTGVPASARADREQLALLFLCRLMFLYFLQRRGHLAGNSSYVASLWNRWRREKAGKKRTFFRAVIGPLFFGALNRRPGDRDDAARALGDVPYLNGGLFERHALEARHGRLDLPDAVVSDVLDGFFERYRFTTRDAADELVDGVADAGVDPEMLGKVFEGMMASGRRGDTGTYYTPAKVVDRVVGEALATYVTARTHLTRDDARRVIANGSVHELEPPVRSAIANAVRGMRVLDPACGSGAFLLGALSRLSRLRRELDPPAEADLRRDIVGRTLHGVDLQADAALLCALRLWLALTVETEAPSRTVPPLPNLDRRIRQGNSLIDPLDLGEVHVQDGGPDRGAALDSRVRHAFRTLTPAGARYLTAEPAEKQALKRELARRERELATAWLAALDDRLGHRIAELRSIAATRDLWGDEVPACAAASAAIPSLSARRAELAQLAEALQEGGTLPFFSFRVHFAECAGGFDLVLSNPPWVRAHRWPASVGQLVRRRYAVCREPGWRYGAALAGAPVAAGAQVDLSQLFLERSLALLAQGGVLAMLIPAKTFRSLYGGPARQMLLRETRLAAIEDHSLDQRSVFRADAFAGVVIASKNAEQDPRSEGRSGDAEPVQVALLRRGVAPLRFELPQHDLPLFPGDLQAPWLLVPEPVRRALRKMQSAGPPLGAEPALRVRRGVFTGANHVLLVRDAKPRLSGLCQIRAEGCVRGGDTGDHSASSYEAIIELECLRPLLRGCDVGAWRYRIASYVIWVHDVEGKPAAPPPRLRRYLARHDDALRARSGSRPGSPAGSLFRVSSATLGHKVVWHDLAETLNAVAVPASIRSPLGVDHAVVPLNTVYFIATEDADQALLLAAYFNSLPVRTFARAIAERAKDARFRFFAWTVAALPLPLAWQHNARALLDLSRKAHADGALESDRVAELDDIVRSAYGLGPEDARALAEYDAWLRGSS